MATIIKVDGTEEELKDPTFAAIQEAVGGYVERVRLLKMTQVLYCDEDGMMKQLRWNAKASELAGMVIIGTVVVLTPEETKKDETDA